MPQDYYQTLGVTRKASPEEIKQAFIRLAKVHHPDKGGDEAKFKEINEAFQVLGSAEKRAHYDKTGADFKEQGGFGKDKNWDDFMKFANGQAVNMASQNTDFNWTGLQMIFAGITDSQSPKLPVEDAVEQVMNTAVGGGGKEVVGGAMDAAADATNELLGGEILGEFLDNLTGGPKDDTIDK